MRITIPHQKSRPEAIRLVDDISGRLLAPGLPGPVRVTGACREWSGAAMSLTATVSFGPIRAPVRALVTVLESEIVIEVDLPPAVTKLVGEESIRTAVESRVGGLLSR